MTSQSYHTDQRAKDYSIDILGHEETHCGSQCILCPCSWQHLACSGRAPRVLDASMSCHRAPLSSSGCHSAPHGFSADPCRTPAVPSLSSRQLTPHAMAVVLLSWPELEISPHI